MKEDGSQVKLRRNLKRSGYAFLLFYEVFFKQVKTELQFFYDYEISMVVSFP